MRVLQLISSSGLYGAERVLLELSCYLRDNGVEVHVGALEHEGAGRIAVLAEAEALGLATVGFPCKGALDPRLPTRMARFLRTQRLDILHAHNYKVDIYGYLACLGAPTVTPLATCHNWLTEGIKLRTFEALDKAALRRFPFVVAVSDAILDKLRAAGVPADQCARIDNGMAVSPLNGGGGKRAARRSLGLPEQGVVAVTVGRMDNFKAHHLQLRALDQLRREHGLSVRLLLVGEGEQDSVLRELCGQLGLDDLVTFTGYLPDVRPALAAADIFLLSSIKEGLPMVLLEAMGAGLPVVSTSVGGIPEALQQGRAGLLVPPNQPSALADAVARLVRAPREASSLARAGRRRYEACYSREAMGRSYLDLYQRLLAAKA